MQEEEIDWLDWFVIIMILFHTGLFLIYPSNAMDIIREWLSKYPVYGFLELLWFLGWIRMMIKFGAEKEKRELRRYIR